jgi:hypothetical protein
MMVYLRPIFFGAFLSVLERSFDAAERFVVRAAVGLGTARPWLAAEAGFGRLPVITYSLSCAADSPANFRFARLRPAL